MTRSILYFFLFSLVAQGQHWRYWGGDAGGQKYSPLKQIDRSNVTRLKVAWTYHTGEISDGKKYSTVSAFEATPLYVDGRLYVTTPFNRLVALEPETGKELWSFDPGIDLDRPHSLFISRGATFWRHGGEERLFLGTIEGRMYAIDPKSGKPIDGFGKGGSIDLREGMTTGNPRERVAATSPPVFYKNLVITGSAVSDGEPRGPSGDVRAFDARTGKLVWRFHVIPRPGEFGHETWEGDSWKDRSGANAWSVLSVDEQRGIVYLPLTSPGYDYYAGDRKGDNLFGDSIVALEAETGKRIWHFQTIHHDIWDWDLPAQPILVDVEREGRTIPGVVQLTKTGWVFLFDRVTGKPLFPIEDRPVPQSDVPGEKTSPTQPFPLKPPPLTRHTMTREELTDVTPESRAFCEKLVEGAVFAKSLYTPIGLQPTVMFPSTNGGVNWGGGSFDPETRTLYVNSMEIGMLYQMIERPEGSTIPYRTRGRGTPNSRFWTQELLPCQKPPWGFLTAVDLNSGEFRWRSVLGVIDELLEKGIPPTGTSNLGGSMVTAGGLVFIGATNDSRFRAFDKDTGKELWTVRLPASAHANPMTFQSSRNGKQYVVIAAGGGNKYNDTYSDSLVAYSLE